MTKPTREAVEEMLNDFEAHELIGSRRDVYELVVSVLRDWLAQEEELEGLERGFCEKIEKIGDLVVNVQLLQAENQALKTKGEQLCCRVGVLEMENQALKASMEADYIERQAKRIQALVGENESLKEALKKILGWRERDRESMGEIIHYIEGLASQALKERLAKAITYGTPKKGEPLPYHIDEEKVGEDKLRSGFQRTIDELSRTIDLLKDENQALKEALEGLDSLERYTHLYKDQQP